MHPKFDKAEKLSREAIGAGIEVHRLIGPGLIESVYEKCFVHELDLRGISFHKQSDVPIVYKGIVFSETLRFDVLLEDLVLIELKAAQEVLPIHKAKLLSYMKLLKVPLGLIMNFHQPRLVDGISRMILPGTDPSQ